MQPPETSQPATRRRYRPRNGARRRRRISISLTETEYLEVLAATRADGGGLTPSSYAAAATIAAARSGRTPQLEPLRDAIAAVIAARAAINKFGSNVNQAVAALHATGQAPVWLARAVALCARAVETAEETMRELRRQVRR